MLQAFELWAKTGRTPDEWHCLPCHLLDVAATAECLFDYTPKHVQRRVAQWLGTTVGGGRSLVAFLAAAHDIGKGNPYFQAKAPEHRARLQHLGLVTVDKEPFTHGQATNALAKTWLKARTDWTPEQVVAIACSIGGHHGHFLRGSSLAPLRLDSGPWQGLAHETLDALKEVIGTSFPPLPDAKLNPFLAWLAGFVSVADWLGSHEEMVVYRSESTDLAEYYEQARDRARSLFAKLGFNISRGAGPLPLTQLLPQGAEPNPMQRLADEVGRMDFQLAILEAPTGEGKTEAALALIDRFRADGAGIYFAMPTMATANGLVTRVDQYLESAFPDAVERARLLHSMASLFDSPGRVVANPFEEGQTLSAEDWFASSKRGLLAPNGIGTIDQALVGSIRVKHFFVRLFALTGKLIVIDEVHAYDLYMSDLLGVLLAWMRVLGCRVILLSATLPNAKRRELLSHWGVHELPYAAYPCLTWVTASGEAASATFAVASRKPLELALSQALEQHDDLPGVQEIINLVASNGGFGALIVNTVSAAQRAFARLNELCEERDIDVELFHARFTASDRQRIEQKVLDRFGKKGARNRSAILVASQVVEQSLDLDFDWMVTELAPIDLLIQRSGRLHRHRRDRDGNLAKGSEPDSRPDPRLHIVCSEGWSPESNGNRGVYKQSVLVATHDAISPGVTIRSAEGVSRLVEAVYGRLDAAQASDSQDALATLRETERATETRASRVAEDVTITHPDSCDPISLMRNVFDEDDGYDHARVAKTRLETMPSISIVVWPEDRPLPTLPLSFSAKRELVLQVVRISAGSQVIQALSSLNAVPGSDKVKALQRVHLAVMDSDGSFYAGDYQFRYTVTTGLSWEKKSA